MIVRKTKKMLIIIILEIYRIVSNKALESSNDVIRPTAGQTINVNQPTEDEKQGGGCC